ncbi:carbamoyltransferase family protein [Opacimonas viscosa]|uniref:Carbamoyltransferase n=1 Tax=Opacimonas viscosa TaxID=2961944 RepID=A0AA41X566_9ALTE|nr:carbamoyltransferase [Opacimonas viscosa]MCP3428819.1 carbamoyltransferase [Opacimonas viscosa]
MSNNYVLGISALYHDSAAALLVNGKIIAAAQEERFTRIKHDPSFPTQAILYCLDEAGITLDECSAIVFYDKPLLKFERLLETYLAHAPKGFLSFARAMPIWLKEKLYFKQLLRRECRNILRQDNVLPDKTLNTKIPPLAFSEHHLSHAASAFYPSPFTSAVVLCLDGVGEWATTSAWLGKNEELKPLWEINFPHSLGLLYSAFTYYCGFKVNAGEYKLMGLAPYGKPVYKDIIYRHLITVADDGSFALNLDYFDFSVGKTMVNKAFCALFSTPVLPHDSPVTKVQMDLAASIQVVIEETVLKMARHLKRTTQADYLCLAGGVALNCVANGRIAREAGFQDIWIQPAAGDAGGALGAALEYCYRWELGERISVPSERDSVRSDAMQHSYLGPAFSIAEIKSACLAWGVEYTELTTTELLPKTVRWLTEEAVVGWFQGRMEFGPRALGNRSILGDPRSANMQHTMNLKIKQRESFRPFAPIVMQEHVQDWFVDIEHSPYMLQVAQVQSQHLCHSTDQTVADMRYAQRLDRPITATDFTDQMQHTINQIRSYIPAVTHIDYSARVQTVTSAQPIHSLLTEFQRHTGVPLLINTSFNVRGEPPVCSPHDAIRCFLATEMDYLVMENIVLEKADMPDAAKHKAQEVTFAKD